jgi:muramoyltetrapeptide carboxypeptidase
VPIKPHRLKPGDLIGVCSPAGPVEEEELRPGIKALESLGFRVYLSSHCLMKKAYLAGADELRLRDLHGLFQDDKVKAIICARGGYGSLRLFERIDFDLIRKHPKILVGYSDITALLLAVYKRAHLVTIHGPVLRDMTKNHGLNLGSLTKLMTSRESVTMRFEGAKVLMEGLAAGKLLGGNLSLITHLLGTSFMPSLQGALLFLEERGEAPYRVDRMLTHLRLSGLLNKCAGVMTGSFQDCGEPSTVEALIRERLGDLHLPMMIGLPIGHGEVNTALPIGVKAVLDTGQKTLTVSEACVKA